MPLKSFALFALLLSMIVSANGVNAMNPQVRLPEWHRCNFAIAEWQPDEGLLVFRVEIEATAVTLQQITSRLHLPKGLEQQQDIRERQSLKKGEKAVFLHRIKVKPDYCGWIEVDLRAMPDKKEMLELVKKVHAGEPLTAKILESEVSVIEQPLTIGISYPILVRRDIAISSSAEMAFKPDQKAGNQSLYMWYPPEKAGKGITAEGMKAFANALQLGNLKTAEAAAAMLIKKFNSQDEPLVLEKTDGESFMIPARMVIELINADMLTMRAQIGKDTAGLEKSLESMQPGFTRPFLYFNLGVLLASNKAGAKAEAAFQKAIKDVPAWPLAEKKLKKSSK